MKTPFFVFLFFLLFSKTAFAQENPIVTFQQERIHLNQHGMKVLGSWAGVNLITNSILRANTTTGSNRYFYEMNIYWNVVNGTLAGLGLLQNKNQDYSNSGVLLSLEEQHAIEKTFLINSGLDVAYVMTGVYLLEKSKNSTDQEERLKGYGQSVILQGGFLLLFDGIMYGVHRSHYTKNKRIFQHIIFTGNQLGLVWKF